MKTRPSLPCNKLPWDSPLKVSPFSCSTGGLLSLSTMVKAVLPFAKHRRMYWPLGLPMTTMFPVPVLAWASSYCASRISVSWTMSASSLKYVNRSFASRRAIDIAQSDKTPPDTTILSRPGERKIEYGLVERCGSGGDSAAAAARICAGSLPVTLVRKRRFFVRGKKTGNNPYPPSARIVALKVMESGAIRRVITGD